MTVGSRSIASDTASAHAMSSSTTSLRVFGQFAEHQLQGADAGNVAPKALGNPPEGRSTPTLRFAYSTISSAERTLLQCPTPLRADEPNSPWRVTEAAHLAGQL